MVFLACVHLALFLALSFCCTHSAATGGGPPKTDVTRAILSRDFVAQLYRAIIWQRATVQLHAATLSRKQTKPTRLIMTLLQVV